MSASASFSGLPGQDQAPGGDSASASFYASYIPSAEDTSIFEDLGTNYYHRALQTARPSSVLQATALETLFDEMQALANATPNDTGTDIRPWTDALKRAQVEQAKVRTQYKLGSLMVFIGKDITIEDYVNQRGFMDGKSRAAMLTKGLLRHLARHEMERLDLDEEEEWTGDFDTDNLFPFFDLWPWLKHVRLDIAVDFLRQYLAIVRPLIVNAYSKPVSSITRANFLHEFGLPRSSLVEHVGELTIQYYSSTSWVNERCDGPDPDTAFINIPHLHPGFDKYGEQPVELRRVFDMTMQLTFLVASAAMDVNEELLNSGEKLNRFDICEKVLEQVNATLHTTSEGQTFSDAFRDAKHDLQNYLTVRRAKLNRVSKRSLLGFEGEDLLAKIGLAQGQPNSLERSEDLHRLWNANIPEMHLAVPHDQVLKAEWMQHLKSLQQGQSYFLAVSSHMKEENEYVRQVISLLETFVGLRF
ncbi:hypothetical protein PG991_005934 [Apiospora marii]|uniref:Uncharacterized protein n=1 Tax=Apiospora marii TaxID=335849 RepID=A0ABR1SAR6_9PEZI